VIEQAASFAEAGAGVQLGPNTASILRHWGLLGGELGGLVARPSRLCVRDAASARELASLRLGDAFEQRYGAPYLTAHRADLHGALLRAAQAEGARLACGMRVVQARQDARSVHAATSSGEQFEAEGLVGADGLWSRVRERVIPDDAPPRPTGHLAYRALVRQGDLPSALRTGEITAWLGARLHAVSYPVRAGEWLNVVCVTEGSVRGDPRGWDRAAVAADLRASTAGVSAPLRELLDAAPQWRLWVLHDRAPLASASQMAAGRIALLGDAAHPMLPYLAQGAGMAIEDACELQRLWSEQADVAEAFARYAARRWERCARVQRRSRRNGTIFHASGLMRSGRDLSLRLFGESLIDLPWLYGRSVIAPRRPSRG
jgi:salicylate hydroxylase